MELNFDSLGSLNPFGGEKYETKILADVPADDIYDQGVARLSKKDTSGAAKKFGQLEKDYAYSDWARKGLLMEAAAQFQGGQFTDSAETAAEITAEITIPTCLLSSMECNAAVGRELWHSTAEIMTSSTRSH